MRKPEVVSFFFPRIQRLLWPRPGHRFVFVLAILATVVKSIFSYMLVLVASLGWGVTRPYLDQPTILKAWNRDDLVLVAAWILDGSMAESPWRSRHCPAFTSSWTLFASRPCPSGALKSHWKNLYWLVVTGICFICSIYWE